MKVKVMWGIRRGDPEWKEELITEREERFEKARAWATAQGFDRFRIATIDLAQKPDFAKAVRS